MGETSTNLVALSSSQLQLAHFLALITPLKDS
jgi:hypothetical protein